MKDEFIEIEVSFTSLKRYYRLILCCVQVYVILSSLRLLKVNFYQMTKAGIKPRDLTSTDIHDCDVLLARIKNVLFALSDGNGNGSKDAAASPGELLIRRESMHVMRVGFSILFPSPIEQAAFLGQLLQKDRYKSLRNCEALARMFFVSFFFLSLLFSFQFYTTSKLLKIP